MRNPPNFSVSPVLFCGGGGGYELRCGRLPVGGRVAGVARSLLCACGEFWRSALFLIAFSPLRLALSVLSVAVFSVWLCCTPLQCPRLTWRSTGARF